MGELKLTGNCIKGSRPLLCFSKEFKSTQELKSIKKTLKGIFSTPQLHPKSKPFVDHILSFFWIDGKIWFRNYQIITNEERTLQEIGPRFALWPVKIFDMPFQGTTLWKNETYQENKDTFRKQEREKKLRRSNKFLQKEEETENQKNEKEEKPEDLNEIFKQ